MHSHQGQYILYYINHQSINPLTSINQTIGIIDNMIQQDILKQKLSEKKASCEALEEEIVKTRNKMEKFKGLYHQNMPSIKASEGLTSILNQQRNSKLKAGLGYEEGSSSDHPSNTEPIKFVKSSNIDNSHSTETKKEN
jgi:hypothetical protein